MTRSWKTAGHLACNVRLYKAEDAVSHKLLSLKHTYRRILIPQAQSAPIYY